MKKYFELWEKNLDLKLLSLQADLNDLVDQRFVAISIPYTKKSHHGLARAIEKLGWKYGTDIKLTIINEQELQKSIIDV